MKELPIIDVINSIISLKWLCQTLTPKYFQHLNTCIFFKTKLVSHSIKVRSHYNFLKPLLVYVVKIMESAMFPSNCRSAIQVSYVPVRQWLEILINGFLIKKFWLWWVMVNGGGYILAGSGWWWIYFSWWWVLVGDSRDILAGGGWWWMVVDGDGWCGWWRHNLI